MTRILILTKNPLAEQELQYCLQRSNEEVYCSFHLIQEAERHSDVIHYFSMVIFSDTISTHEVSESLSYYKKKGLAILRKGNKGDLKKSEHAHLEDDIDGWIEEHMTPSMVIEIIEKRKQKKQLENALSLFDSSNNDQELNKNCQQFVNSLTKKEQKILHQLYEAKGATVAREELCHLIWEAEPNNSNLSQLSSLIRKMKRKVYTAGFEEKEIATTWGHGYRLEEKLVAILQKNDYFVNQQGVFLKP